MTKSQRLMTALYTFAHFTVDLSCAYFTFKNMENIADGAFLFLVYNFFAFAMQMPLGAVCDKLNRNFGFAGVGCILVLISSFLWNVPLLAVSVCGLGNAIFHLGGGTDVLNYSDKCSACGIFVSSGAVGLYLGTLSAKNGINLSLIIGFVLIALAVGMTLAQKKLFGRLYSENAPFSLPSLNLRTGGAAAIFLIVVILRSLVGFGTAFPWKVGIFAFLAVLATALGKALGGIFSDKLGIVKVSALSLIISGILFLFGGNPVCGLLSLLLFNFTMPITLKSSAEIFSGCKGFSFGLMTFGLFCGFLPVYLNESGFSLNPMLLAFLSVFSAAALVGAFTLTKKGGI